MFSDICRGGIKFVDLFFSQRVFSLYSKSCPDIYEGQIVMKITVKLVTYVFHVIISISLFYYAMSLLVLVLIIVSLSRSNVIYGA